MPDHIGRRWKCADGLHQLAQGHEQEQSKERSNASAEKPASQEEQAQGINQCQAYDQERVGRAYIPSEVEIESSGQVVERVAKSGCRRNS